MSIGSFLMIHVHINGTYLYLYCIQLLWNLQVHEDVHFLSHLYIMGFCVDFFRELGQGVLGFQYEVVSIILVVDTADHIQNDCTQYTATGL